MLNGDSIDGKELKSISVMAYIGMIILNFHKNLPIGSLGGTDRHTDRYDYTICL